MIQYTVSRIGAKEAKEYIRANHYSKGSHNGPSPCYGLFDGTTLIGVLMFATPCSENVRASVFGPHMKDAVVELHRLHVMDGTPKNTESWFISRCLRNLRSDRPQTKAVLSFADATQGHTGVIYRATNAIFTGMSGKATFFIDGEGRLRHPRQNGVNVDGVALGWTPTKRMGKYRYLWLIGSTFEARKLKQMCKLEAVG